MTASRETTSSRISSRSRPVPSSTGAVLRPGLRPPPAEGTTARSAYSAGASTRSARRPDVQRPGQAAAASWPSASAAAMAGSSITSRASSSDRASRAGQQEDGLQPEELADDAAQQRTDRLRAPCEEPVAGVHPAEQPIRHDPLTQRDGDHVPDDDEQRRRRGTTAPMTIALGREGRHGEAERDDEDAGEEHRHAAEAGLERGGHQRAEQAADGERVSRMPKQARTDASARAHRVQDEAPPGRPCPPG